MILAFVPTYIPFDPGSSVSTMLDNGGIPDWLIGTHFEDAQNRLDRYVGNILAYTGNRFMKCYMDWGGILHEYTMVEVTLTHLNKPETRYVPISIKRYKNEHATLLYAAAINRIGHMVGLAQNTPIVTFSDLIAGMTEGLDLTALCDQMIDDPAELVTANAPLVMMGHRSDIHHTMTPDIPKTMSDVMTEIGMYCLTYKQSALQCLYTIYGEHILAVPNLYLEDPFTDPITRLAIGSVPFLSERFLNSMMHRSMQTLHTDLANDQFRNLEQRGREVHIDYLDRTTVLYEVLQIDSLVESLFMEHATDIIGYTGRGVETAVEARNFITNQASESYHVTSWFEQIRQTVIEHPVTKHFQIKMVSIQKTYLDGLFIIVEYDRDNLIEYWYMNLALYHLISPAIIRTDFRDAVQPI